MGDEHLHSAVRHLNAFGRKYPKAWEWLDKYRDFRNGLVNKDNPAAAYVHTTMSTVATALCVGVLSALSRLQVGAARRRAPVQPEVVAADPSESR